MQEGQGGGELREYLKVLRRRKGIIVLALLTVVGAALGVSFMQTPVYQASAELLLQSKSTASLFGLGGSSAGDQARSVATQIQVIQTAPIRAEVRKRIGIAPPLSVAQVEATDVIRLTATSTKPRIAAVVPNTYAQAYIDLRRSQNLEDLAAVAQQVQGKVNDLQKQIDALPQPGAKVDPSLSTRRDSLISQQSVFKQRLDQLQVTSALSTGDAQLVTPASEPTGMLGSMPPCQRAYWPSLSGVLHARRTRSS